MEEFFMRLRGKRRAPETPPDPEQEETPYIEVDGEDFSTVETIALRENQLADEANVEELERITKDLTGRSAQQVDGAVPVEPLDYDPLALAHPEKPKRPPK